MKNLKMHRKTWKQSQVQELSPLFKKYKTIAVGDLSGMPSSLVQKLRKNLNDKAVLKVSKTRVIKKALESVSDKKQVAPLVNKSCLIIFSDLDPFELFSLVKKNRAKAFAKEGYVAEEDILVPAGDTGLPPGPALSELKAAGLQLKIQGPTIQITEDKIVTKKGERVTKPVAAVLAKLDIKPVKIGLKLSGVFEESVMFLPQVLDIDTEKVFNDFASAYTKAVNLSFNAQIFNSASMPLLLGRAFREAKEVALAGNVFTKETMPQILAKALNAAKAVENAMPETSAQATEAKTENKEEASVEEKKEGESLNK